MTAAETAHGSTLGRWVTVTDPRRRPLGFLGAIAGAAAFATQVPPVGAVVGVAFVLAWVGTPAPYAVAFGTVALAAFTPSSAFVVGLAGVGALGVLGDALRTGDRATDLRALAAFVLAAVVLLAVVGVAGTATDATWLLALALVAAGATLAYGTHRYERVAMGLVTEDDP